MVRQSGCFRTPPIRKRELWEKQVGTQQGRLGQLFVTLDHNFIYCLDQWSPAFSEPRAVRGGGAEHPPRSLVGGVCLHACAHGRGVLMGGQGARSLAHGWGTYMFGRGGSAWGAGDLSL